VPNAKLRMVYPLCQYDLLHLPLRDQ
jgi:hypothetical protein